MLITGAGGFIGSRLAAACLAAGDEVHALLRKAGRPPDRLAPILSRITCHPVDLASESELRALFAWVVPDLVFHLAGNPRRGAAPGLEDAAQSVTEELAALLNLLKAAASAPRPPKRIVRAGSLAEYGSRPAPYRETDREEPVNVYGASLVAGTHMIAALAATLPFPVVTARLALVYGPGQSTDYLIPTMIANCLAGIATDIRHPDDRRDLIHVDDAVDGLLRLADRPLDAVRLVNLASGEAPSMRVVASTVARFTGAPPGLIRLGDGTGSIVSDLRADPGLAWRQFGWRATTGLADGLARTMAETLAAAAP